MPEGKVDEEILLAMEKPKSLFPGPVCYRYSICGASLGKYLPTYYIPRTVLSTEG